MKTHSPLIPGAPRAQQLVFSLAWVHQFSFLRPWPKTKVIPSRFPSALGPWGPAPLGTRAKESWESWVPGSSANSIFFASIRRFACIRVSISIRLFSTNRASSKSKVSPTVGLHPGPSSSNKTNEKLPHADWGFRKLCFAGALERETISLGPCSDPLPSLESKANHSTFNRLQNQVAW